MKILVNASLNDFVSNKKLLLKYSKRQLEAIYEMLFDRRLGKVVARMLDEQNLINIRVEEEPLEGPWAKYKQRYIIIGLKHERTALPTMLTL